MTKFEATNIGNGRFKVKIDGVEQAKLYSMKDLGTLYASCWGPLKSER